uniref:Putative secreted protein n=1 Tax=Anopheles triannulatus TaxID=58253 RepID=A0A2M4B774_9DIPT
MLALLLLLRKVLLSLLLEGKSIRGPKASRSTLKTALRNVCVCGCNLQQPSHARPAATRGGGIIYKPPSGGGVWFGHYQLRIAIAPFATVN